MVKLEDLSKEGQVLVKSFELGLKNKELADKMYLEALHKKEELIRMELCFKYDEEPLKIFKKRHKKWQDEIDALDSQLMDIYKKGEELFLENHEFYKELSSHKKKSSAVC